jgi:hypothetical protein
MKAWLIYWFVGCAIVGVPMGSLMRECPDAEVKSADVLTAVATWPAIIIAAISSGKIERSSKCPAFPNT